MHNRAEDLVDNSGKLNRRSIHERDDRVECRPTKETERSGNEMVHQTLRVTSSSPLLRLDHSLQLAFDRNSWGDGRGERGARALY